MPAPPSKDVPRWQQWHKRHHETFLRSVVVEQEAIAGRLGFRGWKPGRPISIREQVAAREFCDHLARERNTTARSIRGLDEYVTKHEERLTNVQALHHEAVTASIEINRLQVVMEDMEGTQDALEKKDIEACIESLQQSAEQSEKLARVVADTQRSVDLWRWRRERAWVRLRYLTELRETIERALSPLTETE